MAISCFCTKETSRKKPWRCARERRNRKKKSTKMKWNQHHGYTIWNDFRIRTHEISSHIVGYAIKFKLNARPFARQRIHIDLCSCWIISLLIFHKSFVNLAVNESLIPTYIYPVKEKEDEECFRIKRDAAPTVGHLKYIYAKRITTTTTSAR